MLTRSKKQPTALRPNRGAKHKPKPRNLKDPDYLAWLRTQDCIVPANLHAGVTEAAHTGIRGLSQKPSDREALPICSYHHRLGADAQHRIGKYFWKAWDIDREAEIKKHNKRFEAEGK